MAEEKKLRSYMANMQMEIVSDDDKTECTPFLTPCVLYGIYRIGYATDGFDGMRQEIEQMPQSIRDLVDKMIEESKQKED